MAAESAKVCEPFPHPSTMLTVQFNEQRSVQSLNNARAEILSLNKAVADAEERFAKYRAEKVGNFRLWGTVLLT